MGSFQYDVFLSFAVEDKLEVVNELYHLLTKKGLSVWYSGQELQIGARLDETINEGLNRSRYGIVIITSHYFRTNWTQKELALLWSKEREGKPVILPVLHNITPEEVGAQDPTLASRWSINTKEGLDIVADKIHAYIQGEQAKTAKKSYFKWVLGGAVSIILLLIFGYWINRTPDLTSETINRVVDNRIKTYQSQIEMDIKKLFQSNSLRSINGSEVTTFVNEFQQLKVQYRNYYSFNNGFENIQFHKYVAPTSQIDFETWSSATDYDFTHPNIYLVVRDKESPYFDKTFIYFNTQPVKYSIEDQNGDLDSLIKVQVEYEESLRMVSFHYAYHAGTDYRKHTTYELMGFKPVETYTFSFEKDQWKLKEVE